MRLAVSRLIAAYQTEYNSRKITLLDTPGHEAFAALRQHGATLTDVVIIVVAADDGVKPQTVEAIKFARSANANIRCAINKIDKPTANSQLVKTQLATGYRLDPEEWGGDTIMVEISAKTGQGIDKLLEMVLLVADAEDLRADIDVPGRWFSDQIERRTRTRCGGACSDRERYVEARRILCDWVNLCEVRTLQDFRGNPLKQAGPSTPVTF